MKNVNFNCLSTAIGSMPGIDTLKAYELVKKYLPYIPHWPQLPHRSSFESMYIQFSEGFPGIRVKGDRIWIEQDYRFYEEAERLNDDYENDKYAPYKISQKYAAGIYSLSQVEFPQITFLKGQIIGPVSFGLGIKNSLGIPIIYDDQLADLVMKFICLKASWQENFLKSIFSETIIFFDEPYLSSLGSAFLSLEEEKIKYLLNEALSGVKGIKGIHCCGNTSWPLVLGLPVNIVNFDAYNYGDSFCLYTEDLFNYLQKGGTIAWGIVSNEDEAIDKETTCSLKERIIGHLNKLTINGLTVNKILKQSIITPTCGLAGVSPMRVNKVLMTLADLSKAIQDAYL